MRLRLTAMLLLVLGAGLALFAAPGASAATSGAQEGVHINGRLVDETNPARPQPVEGVEVTVTTEEGQVVGTDTTDAKGEFSVEIPGGGIYLVRINTDTLPEGTQLRNPDDVERRVQSFGFDITVQFPIGPDTRDVETAFAQVPGLLANGLLFGLTLALASLGLSMVFGTTGLVNFSHGELITFGAIVAYAFNVGLGFSVIVAGILATFVAGVFGYAQETGLWRPLRHRGTGLIAMMIVTIGLAIFLRSMYQYIFGGDTRAYTEYATQQSVEWLPVPMRPAALVTIGVCLVVLVAVSLALQLTRTGKATRAVADNPALAASSGINVDRVIAVVWIVGTGLAGLAGVLLGVNQQVNYQLGLRVLLLVFASVVLGGLGTIWGAMLGSIVVGVFIEVSTVVVAPELKYVGALAILILILLVRPQGILGRAQRVG